MPDTPTPPDDNMQRQMADGYTMALHLVVSTLVGLAMGVGLDKWLGTAPLFILVFMGLGFVAGFRRMYMALVPPQK
ncbi:MAG: AtpZ/AtpI family protein [Alphaproteobacteria bacterium]